VIVRHRLLVVAAVVVIIVLGFFLLKPKSDKTAADNIPRTALTVTVAQPTRENWPRTVQANGSLAAWQEAIISAETGNLRITDLFVDMGAHVKKGQELARLSQDSVKANLQKQQAVVAQADATLRQAASNAERARSIKDSGALSAEKFNDYQISEATARASQAAAEAELASIRLQLAQTRIVAVDDGVVSSRNAVLGNVVATGSELFRLLRKGRIEWQAELDSVQLAQIKVGQAARISLPDGNIVTGKVRLIAPTLNTNTGRGLVYVSLNKGAVRTGIYSSGEIDLDASPAVTVPATAVVMRDGRSYVFSVDTQQQAVRHAVTTGRRRDDRIEILSGLDAGATVVDSGGAFLSDGMKVTVKKSGS